MFTFTIAEKHTPLFLKRDMKYNLPHSASVEVSQILNE